MRVPGHSDSGTPADACAPPPRAVPKDTRRCTDAAPPSGGFSCRSPSSGATRCAAHLCRARQAASRSGPLRRWPARVHSGAHQHLALLAKPST